MGVRNLLEHSTGFEHASIYDMSNLTLLDDHVVEQLESSPTTPESNIG